MVNILKKILAVRFIRQFIKFCIVGGTAAVIHFGLLVSLTEYLGIWYVISNIVAFLAAATFNFVANKFWTFRNKENGRQAYEQIAKFILVVVSGLIINTLIIYILTDHFGLDYRLSWVFATGVVTFWNFFLNRTWTFRHKKNEDILPVI